MCMCYVYVGTAMECMRSCAQVCASCVGRHMGVAVDVRWLGDAHSERRMEAGCDAAVETADEGGGDTFEAAAFVAGDRAARVKRRSTDSCVQRREQSPIERR